MVLTHYTLITPCKYGILHYLACIEREDKDNNNMEAQN